MATNLLEYLLKRNNIEDDSYIPEGPFITISRETGCNATEIAKSLVKSFRKRGQQWHFINKEILDESARMLQIDRNKLEHDFIIESGNAMDDVIKALILRHFKNDKKIRDTIANIVQYEAGKGNVIIIGRASSVSTRNIRNGLHVRLVAPLDWRVNEIVKRKPLSYNQALEFIIENDLRRKKLLEDFAQKKIDEIPFDLIINRQVFNVKQTTDLILNTMEIKGIL